MSDDLERVLQAAGPREKPPEAVERELRDSLRREWQRLVAERRARRQRVVLALAASLAAVTIGTWLAIQSPIRPGEVVATMTLASGDVRAKSGWFDRWKEVADRAAVTAGQAVETGAAGRGALTLDSGISARLDHGTRIRLASAERLIVERGAVYVDTGADSGASPPLEVVTPNGVVRHMGTQYEVRLLQSGVRVRVREGQVEWATAGRAPEIGHAGEQLTIRGDGELDRDFVPAYGESWEWVAAAAPAIEIEGLPLTRFLDWAARELGCQLEFASIDVAREAAAVILHGSVAGLAPAAALEAVVATTRMRAVVSDGRIVMESRR